MLRLGLDNNIGNATATSSVNILGYNPENVLDDTVTSWAGTNACTLSLTWASSFDCQLLTLHRVNLITNVTITGKLATVTVFSGVFTNADLHGIDVFTLYTGLSGTIDELVLSFTGTGTPKVGYIWAGTKQDILFEKLQLVDQSSDIVGITLGNFASSSQRQMYRTLQITLQKSSFTTIRDFMRAIMTRGYGIPRPCVILADTCLVDDSMLAILDSGKTQYDIFDRSGTRLSQVTIGLTEVFGGV